MAPTQAARGELHFNELLILVSAPEIILDLMNIYGHSFEVQLHRKRRREIPTVDLCQPLSAPP